MIIGYYNIANFITLTGMSSALCACYLAFMGHYKAAIVVYMLAGLCDLFDGRVARATDNGDMKRRTFGVQIDTVSDVISFGVAPGVLAYAMGFRDVADVVIYIIFACLGAIRLAYFSTQAITEAPGMKMTCFTGMPIPTISFFLPPLALLMTCVAPETMHWVFKAVYAIIGISFVINVKIKKPGNAFAIFFVFSMTACLIALLCIGEMQTLLA